MMGDLGIGLPEMRAKVVARAIRPEIAPSRAPNSVMLKAFNRGRAFQVHIYGASQSGRSESNAVAEQKEETSAR